MNSDVETGEDLIRSSLHRLLSRRGQSNPRSDQFENVSAVLRFEIGGLVDVPQHALLHRRLQQQQQQTLQTVDHCTSASLAPSITLFFWHFLIAAGHRGGRKPHKLKAVIDHHIGDALARKSHHAQAKLGEHRAVPDGLGVRKVEQIVETRLQRVSVDRAFLALHHRIERVHVPTELAVLREREILVRRDGLKQRLDLLRICSSQSTRNPTLNQRTVERFDLRNVVSKNKHVHEVQSRHQEVRTEDMQSTPHRINESWSRMKILRITSTSFFTKSRATNTWS